MSRFFSLFAMLCACLTIPALPLGVYLHGSGHGLSLAGSFVLVYGPALACVTASIAFACLAEACPSRRARRIARGA